MVFVFALFRLVLIFAKAIGTCCALCLSLLMLMLFRPASTPRNVYNSLLLLLLLLLLSLMSLLVILGPVFHSSSELSELLEMLSFSNSSME